MTTQDPVEFWENLHAERLGLSERVDFVALDPATCPTDQVRQRTATGPDGQEGSLDDSVVVVRRRD